MRSIISRTVLNVRLLGDSAANYQTSSRLTVVVGGFRDYLADWLILA